MTRPKALLFDVFGTVVDWRASLIVELERFGETHAITADWAGLVDAWRSAYRPTLAKVIKGEAGWARLEVLQRDSLEALAPTYGLAKVNSDLLDEINGFWRRCRPWPDLVEGLNRLKAGAVVAALSNGDVALLVEMAKRGDLAWDMVFSTELFRSYKTHPSTYLGACGLLQLEPAEVMMCAAHNTDLAAAQALGLRTAFIARPTEYGPAGDAKPTGNWDICVSSLTDLAAKLDL